MMIKNKKRLLFVYFLFSLILALYISTTQYQFWHNSSKYWFFFLNCHFREKGALILFFMFILFFFIQKYFLKNINANLNEIIFFSILFATNISLLFLRYHNISFKLFYLLSISAIFIFFFYLINIKYNFQINLSEKSAFFLITILLISLFYLSFISTLKIYKTFHAIGGDLGIFKNVFWLKANNYPDITWIEKPGIVIRDAVHFQPVQYLFLPFVNSKYFTEILYFMQSFILFLSVYFIFLLSQHFFNNNFFSFLISCAYAISPYTIRSIDSDFHFTPFFPFFLLGFIYFSEKRNYPLILFFFLFSCTLREDTALYLSLISFYLFLKIKNKLFFYLSLIAGFYAFILIKHYMPSLHSFNETHALKTLNTLFSPTIINFNSISQFLALLGGTLLLPLFNILCFLLFILPPTISFFSYGGDILFNAQHSALIFPATFVASLYGLKNMINNKTINLILIAYSIFIIQVFLHLAWTPNFKILTNTIIILSLIIFTVILYFDKISSNIKAIFIIFISFFVFYSGYIKYNNYRTESNKERPLTISKAINYLPEDINIPVLTNFSIAPHITNRKYLGIIEHPKTKTEAHILNDIITIKAQSFYIIHDLKGDHIYKPEKANEIFYKIIKLSSKLGFKDITTYNNKNIIVVKFYK